MWQNVKSLVQTIAYFSKLEQWLLISDRLIGAGNYALLMITKKNVEQIRLRLGARISELRVSKGLSQYQFSKMIGMDRTYLISVEKGRRNVSIDNLSKIACGLGVRLSTLLENVDVEMQDC